MSEANADLKAGQISRDSEGIPAQGGIVEADHPIGEQSLKVKQGERSVEHNYRMSGQCYFLPADFLQKRVTNRQNKGAHYNFELVRSVMCVSGERLCRMA